MIRLKEAVIVEGKYDKIKLAGVIDGLILVTEGFGIFKDKKKLNLIRRLAATCGVVILTDSDAAGFRIRSYLMGSLREGKRADLVLLERDPLTADPMSLRDIPVLATWKDGRLIYRREG